MCGSVRLLFIAVVVFAAWIDGSADGARILTIFPMPSPSHIILGDRLVTELAKKGHEITYITALPLKEKIPGVTQVLLTKPAEMMSAMKEKNMFEMESDNVFFSAFFVTMMGLGLADASLEDVAVQKLLKSNEKFDLVLLENFNNDAHYGFAHHFKAPVVLFGTVGACSWTNPIVANPASPSYVPDIFLSYSSHMTFKERVYNTVFSVYNSFVTDVYGMYKQNQVLHKYFPDAPHLSELKYNTSLILLNSHVSTSPPVPHVPNMIEIGGFHVKPSKPLPKDLKEYLDNAKEGVIYFSMGSNLQSSRLPAEKRDAILRVFSKLKQKILWKWEDDNLPGQPANVKISKWLPQQDVLAHPNVKLFITHGGLLSTIEAIYHGVPLLGIPIFGDQKMNIAIAVNNGYAVSVPFSLWSEASISRALNEILNNPKYSENAKQRSKIMHDQPVKPLDSAVYWIEYVIRHNGAYHFRSAALDLSWYEYLLVDVMIFLALDVLVIGVVIYMICAKLCCRSKAAKKDTDSSAVAKKKKNKKD